MRDRSGCGFGRLWLCWAILWLAGCSGGSTPTTPSPVAPVATAPAPAPAPTPTPQTRVVRLADDFDGRRPFPSDNWWNQEITGAPVDPQSDAFISFIGRTRAAHADFGPPPFGIPYLGVGGAEARVSITFVEYGNESDKGFGNETGYPIPDAAKTQANFIEGGVPGGGTDGDRHLLVVGFKRSLALSGIHPEYFSRPCRRTG